MPSNLFYVNDTNNYANVKSVEFAEESVCTSIGDSAFANCSMLTSIYYFGSETDRANVNFPYWNATIKFVCLFLNKSILNM